MTTSESIGSYRVFEMSEDGEMTPRTQPRMTAAECFAFIEEVDKTRAAGGGARRLADMVAGVGPLGVYRRVEGGWEEVLP